MIRETAAFWREVARKVATITWLPGWIYDAILADVEREMSAKNGHKSEVQGCPCGSSGWVKQDGKCGKCGADIGERQASI